MKLTRAQTDVWLAHSLAADPSVLNVPALADVSAALDPRAFQQAYQLLLASSEVLRTTVSQDCAGAPVANTIAVSSGSVDVVHLDGTAANRELGEWLAKRIRRSFQLDQALIDTALIKVGADRTVIFVNQHHLITDGWSTRLIFDRLGVLYRRACDGDKTVEPEASPFSSYVAHENAYRHSEACAADEAFWKSRLSAPVPPPLLYGRKRRGSDAERISCPLGSSRSAMLQALADREHSVGHSGNRSVLAVITASFAAYQWRVSGTETIAIGIPYHNRPAQFRDTLGLFVNVVPLHLSVDAEMRFDDLVRVTARDLDTVLGHAQYPLAQAFNAPIYHSTVNYHVRWSPTFAGIPSLQKLLFAGHLDESLGLEVRRNPRSGAVTVEFDLDGGMFPRHSRREAVHHFLCMLDACLASPDQRIAAPDLMTADERRRVIAWSQGPATTAAADSCLDLIGMRALQAPDATALVDGERTLSYGDLLANARAVAAALADQGVATGDRVGVVAERSIEGITVILGILAAGAAYAPLDPAWPQARTDFILRDAAIRHVVAAEMARRPVEQPRPADHRPRPDDAAYVIYTSGSTGQPKGVVIGHGGLLNHCVASIGAYGISSTDRILQFHALTFDASIEELFPSLCAGATVVLRASEAAVDFEALEQCVARHAVTVLDLPTSFWHEWTRSLVDRGAPFPGTVRIVIVGGEQPSARLYGEWRALAGPHVRWVNGYGPTEATVTSTVFEPMGPAEDDPIPMGRPVANAQVYVLDRERRLVPLGVPGEIYIAGAGVAHGYLNRPDQTSTCFVPDPVDNHGGMTYRTGDVGRFREDGQLQYLGRVDDQVKVRGFRIELAEIEAVLERHPSVAQAAVIVRGLHADRRLVAFIVSTDAVPDSELRLCVRQTLPAYMEPQAFIRLERFPLTSNGKIDRRALAGQDIPPATSPAPPQPGRDPIEAELLEMWRRLLGTDTVGRTDSFVESGGHSLLAARLIHAIGERFGQRLPLAVMFPDTTVERLASELRTSATKSTPAEPLVVNRTGCRPVIVYFHGDYGGAGLYTHRLARLLGPDQPIAIVPPHGIDGRAVPPTIEAMAEDRLPAIQAIAGNGPLLLAGFCNGGLVAYEAGIRMAQCGYDVRGIVLIDTITNSSRYRLLFRLLRWYARVRRLSPIQIRDLRLRWRDRQATVEHLLGLGGDSPHAFHTLRDRLGFIGAALRRKLPSFGTVGRHGPGPGAPPQTGDGDRLWQSYVRAIAAYVPSPTRLPVSLVASDELNDEQAGGEWGRVASSLSVIRIRGEHLTCVTTGLDVVASALITGGNTWIPHSSPGTLSSTADR
ncbi:MAG: tycC3 [Acidobacteria bacterium]|nr:tycC3 [Acidobacteriota bacterium]